MKWTKEETERLKELLKEPTRTIKDIALELGRTYNSVEKKSRAFDRPFKVIKVSNNPVKQVNKLTKEQPKVLLKLLTRTKIPMRSDELLGKMVDLGFEDYNQSELADDISRLFKIGYDIKTMHEGLDKYYSLVRYSIPVGEEFYRKLGKIETPFLATGDFHLGSQTYCQSAFNELVKDIKKYKIKHVSIAGDLLQGRGVYTTEFQDLLMPNIGEQIEACVTILKQIPKSVKLHVVIGNHEEKIKGNVDVGLDPVKIICNMLPNARYYGHVANLQLDKDYAFLMMHGSGYMTRAISYRADVIWDNLVEKPNVFQMGHLHQLGCWCKPPQNNNIIMSGTLQRESAWLMSKGITAQLGWIIVHDINNSGATFSVRRPLHY